MFLKVGLIIRKENELNSQTCLIFLVTVAITTGMLYKDSKTLPEMISGIFLNLLLLLLLQALCLFLFRISVQLFTPLIPFQLLVVDAFKRWATFKAGETADGSTRLRDRGCPRTREMGTELSKSFLAFVCFQTFSYSFGLFFVCWFGVFSFCFFLLAIGKKEQQRGKIAASGHPVLIQQKIVRPDVTC